MEVRIKETDEVVSLQCIDPRTGVDWMPDMIGNAGALNDQFVWNDDDEVFEASQADVDWWQNYINDLEKTDADVAGLAEELGISESDIRERISDETGPDYEMHRSEARRAMQAIRDEQLPF